MVSAEHDLSNSEQSFDVEDSESSKSDEERENAFKQASRKIEVIPLTTNKIEMKLKSK